MRKRLPAELRVLETHGGAGHLHRRVYSDVRGGIVFELDAALAEQLCHQRPTWAVYQGKVQDALAGGAGAHLEVNLLDVDPDGECWPTLESFFVSERPRAATLGVVVTDGLRQKIRLQNAWNFRSLRQAIERWGQVALHERYLEVCQWKLEQLAELRGYEITHWTGYHCGSNDDETHFAAVLARQGV